MRTLTSIAGVLVLAGMASVFSSLCFSQTLDSELGLSETAGAAAPRAMPAQPGRTAAARKGGGDSSKRFAVGAKVSTLGIGGEAAYRLTHRFNVRGGFNFMSVSHTFIDSGITYGGQLRFRSAEAHLDWFFLGPLHVSPGVLLYNGNSVKATVAVPGGETFSLGGTTYESSSAAPLGGNATLALNKVAPSILFGVGNMIPRSGRRFSVPFEIGAIYEGAPKIALNFAGTACLPPSSSGGTCQDVTANPGFQADVAGQQSKFNRDAAPYKFYPIVSLGFAIAF